MRFELTEPEGSSVFKTDPFDRSGTPPRGTVWQAMPEATKEVEDGRPADVLAWLTRVG